MTDAADPGSPMTTLREFAEWVADLTNDPAIFAEATRILAAPPSDQEEPPAHECHWKRKYEGMIRERDDQIHRKRETRRILTERAASAPFVGFDPGHPDGDRSVEIPAASTPVPALDVEQLAEALHNGHDDYRCAGWRWHEVEARDLAAEYLRLSGDEGGAG